MNNELQNANRNGVQKIGTKTIKKIQKRNKLIKIKKGIYVEACQSNAKLNRNHISSSLRWEKMLCIFERESGYCYCGNLLSKIPRALGGLSNMCCLPQKCPRKIKTCAYINFSRHLINLNNADPSIINFFEESDFGKLKFDPSSNENFVDWIKNLIKRKE